MSQAFNKHFDIIFIAGAPGIGKSTIARYLQSKLNTPCFEFGWIPEFQDKGDGKPIGYVEEEAIAFENLSLVAKNYIKHGYKNIIINDLENKRIEQLSKVYANCKYIIISLYTKDEVTLKTRVLDTGRSSGYRDFEAALLTNRNIQKRVKFARENKLDVTNKLPDEILGEIINILTFVE